MITKNKNKPRKRRNEGKTGALFAKGNGVIKKRGRKKPCFLH